MTLLTPPIYEANGVRANDVKTLLASGAAPRLLDRAGVAALLWRGAAMGARLPIVGVRRIAAPGPDTTGEPAQPTRTTLEQFQEALTRATAAKSEDGKIAPLPNEIQGFDRWRAETMDMPSLPCDACFSSSDSGELSVGCRELFGAGALFEAFTWSAGRGRSRSKSGGDSLDVGEQRSREVRAFASVEAQRLHALSAMLPSATRSAVSATGPRPPDGIAPGTTGLALASDLLRRGALVDRDLVTLELHARARGRPVRCPFLDPDVVSAARGLDPHVRFGRPGSGGPFESSGTPRLGPSFWERSARELLSPFIDSALTRERIAAQGILVPDAVAEALVRFRRGDAGWTGVAILLLALLTDWVERNGLVLDPNS